MHRKINWPNNKKFAFTIFDDTDRSNLKDSQLIYNCLDNLGFKTIDGKKFRRICKLRKNYKCINLENSRLYRVSPLTEVDLI